MFLLNRRKNTVFLTVVLAASSLCLSSRLVIAEEVEPSSLPAESPSGFGGPALFFDAQSTRFSRDGRYQVFEGNVVSVAAGTVLTADRIYLDRETEVMRAQGSILLLSKRQVFSGQSLVYHLATGDFKILQASLVTNDPVKVLEISRDVLGFNPDDVQFEAERTKRLAEISLQKRDMQSTYRQASAFGTSNLRDYIDQYAILLEREDLIKSQESVKFSKMSPEKRESFKRRREYWQRNQGTTDRLLADINATAYFRIDGDLLQLQNGNDMVAQRAFWTSCKCDEGESAPWGFRADRIDAQSGGYIDLKDPVLEIKGVPILYLPYLKLPLKESRQSGFLLPYFSYDERSGNIFSQPVYFALSESMDSTVSTDIMEKRGTRLAVEYRKKIRKNTGLTLQIEGIRDRLWLQDRVRRRDLLRVYDEGLTEALRRQDQGIILAPGETATVRTPEWWQQTGIRNDELIGDCVRARTLEDKERCRSTLQASDEERYRRGLQKRMAIPLNDWRGRFDWRGGIFLAPRLSLVTEGELVSDHRYSEDLYIAREFADILSSTNRAQSFAKTKFVSHLDNNDFYLGLGSTFGDNMYTEGRYAGDQVPFFFTAQSRMVNLLRQDWQIPLYGQADFQNEVIRLSEAEDSIDFKDDTGESTLGDGQWRRGRLRFVSPLVSRSIVSVSHFSDFESRSIEHFGLADQQSSIQSWRTGFTFSLPLDGSMEIGGKDAEPALSEAMIKSRNLRHSMNWDLTFSARPSVVRRGPYGEIYNFDPQADDFDPRELRLLTYYAADRRLEVGNDPDKSFVAREDAMIPHKRIIFATQHNWEVFDRGWSILPGIPATPQVASKGDTPLTSQERARLELQSALDRPIGNDKDLIDASDQWLVNRYQMLESGRIRPLLATGNISYDFYLADLREKAEQRSSEIRAQNLEIDRQVDGILQNDPADSRGEAAALRQQKRVIILPEPWSTLDSTATLSLFDWSLGSSIEYNLYRKKASMVQLSLGLPRYWLTTVGFAFSIGNTSKEFAGSLVDVVQRMRSVGLSTNLIPRVTTFVNLSDRVTDNPGGTAVTVSSKDRWYSSDYQTSSGFTYADDSECWGLKFSRVKKFGLQEGNATYVLQLVVNFLGQSRPVGDNWSPGVLREMEVGTYGESH